VLPISDPLPLSQKFECNNHEEKASTVQNQEKPNIILISGNGKKDFIVQSLRKDFNIHCKEKWHPIQFLLRTKNINAIVSYFGDNEKYDFEFYSKIANTCSFVPKLAIIKNSNDLELARKCGEVGFTKVMLYSDLYILPEKLHELIDNNSIKVTLDDLDITINDDMPDLLKKALLYIEKEYIRLKTIEEITGYLDTSYKTLSCCLKQAFLPNPKVILMFFKIRHSLYYLKENNLSNKEVAYKSGFTDEKRFAECMRRMFEKTPGECRYKLLSSSINTIWHEAIKNRSSLACGFIKTG